MTLSFLGIILFVAGISLIIVSGIFTVHDSTFKALGAGWLKLLAKIAGVILVICSLPCCGNAIGL